MASILLIHSDAIVSDCICRAIVANETGTSLVVAGAVRTLAEGREFMCHRVPDLVAVDLRVSDGPFAPWFNYFRMHRPRPRIVVIAGAVQDPRYWTRCAAAPTATRSRRTDRCRWSACSSKC
jgi:DNA-binding NarL/FixJ family response regulator